MLKADCRKLKAKNMDTEKFLYNVQAENKGSNPKI